MARWIGLACALIVGTGAAAFVVQMLPEPVPEPTIPIHRRPEGPPPKVEVVGSRSHGFGALPAMTRGSHTWEIRNKGGGPLEVWLDSTSCSCTVATLKTAEGEPKKTLTIPPGRSAPIEVTWEARTWGPRFAQSATLGTNDPEESSITLSIVGKIVAPVEVRPSESIALGEISSDEAHRATLEVVSPDRPGLKLMNLATSKPGLIVAGARPMAPDELGRRKVQSGYELTVEVKPGLPGGRFTEEVRIETDHPNRPTLKVLLSGRSVGPISVIPERVRMPSVSSVAGASQDLTLVVSGGRATRIEVASKPEKVRVDLAPEDRTGPKGKYRLTVTVPPGLGPGLVDDPIVLRTDHPKALQVRIPVMIFVSSRSEGG